MNGQMDNHISVNTIRISKVAMVYSHLATDDNIEDFGKMAKDMAWDRLRIKMKNLNMEYGKMENKFHG